MKSRNKAVFYINGIRHEASAEESGLMLSEYLRARRNLTGTKVVCAEGDCGACSVLRSFTPLKNKKRAPFTAMNSCIATVAQMDGSNLITVEGLAGKDNLSPIQDSMVKCHASQCGFCTPGFAVALTELVEKKCALQKGACHLNRQEVKNALTGNLCRCTGYQPIIDAAVEVDITKVKPLHKSYVTQKQEADLKKIQSTPLFLENKEFRFYAPTTLKAATLYLSKHQDARVIGSTTDLGVVSNKRKMTLNHLVSLHLISDLYEIKPIQKGRVCVGARVSLSHMRKAIQKSVPEFARFLDLFASPQIKNVATLVGNIANGSPIADTPPFLLVSDTVIHVLGAKGKRTISFENFYLGYRKTALKPGEFITAIEFAITNRKQTLSLYKSSQRKDLDISAVNAAFQIEWKDHAKKHIHTFKAAMGGVAATPLRLYKTEKLFDNQLLSPELLKKATMSLQTEMQPLSDLRGSSAFRRVTVENLFLKFFRELK